MAEQEKPQEKPPPVEDNPFGPQKIKNKAILRDSIAAAKRWPACPQCGNEAHNTSYTTLAEAKPGATPAMVKMMECSKCGERVDLATGKAVKREAVGAGG